MNISSFHCKNLIFLPVIKILNFNAKCCIQTAQYKIIIGDGKTCKEPVFTIENQKVESFTLVIVTKETHTQLSHTEQNH